MPKSAQTKRSKSEPQDWFEKRVRRRLKRELEERLDQSKLRSQRKPVSVVLGAQQLVDLDEFAAEWSISRNALIRLALSEFLKMEREVIRDEVEHSAE